MKKVNKKQNYTEAKSPELFPAPEGSVDATATAQPDPATTSQFIDLKGIANFAALKGELLLAEHEIFGGAAPGAFARVRNRVIARLTSQGKAGIETGLDLIELKAGLKEENHWVRYGTPIAKRMRLKSVSGLNHIIRRTEHAAKLPKRLLSAMVEEGLEPIDGHNRLLVDNLIARNFSGTSEQALELVRAEQDRVTEAKREARRKSAEKRAKKEAIGARVQEPTDQPWGKKLRNCPEGERLALMGEMVAALNSEMATCLPSHKVQLVPVTGATGETDTSQRIDTPVESPGEVLGAEPKPALTPSGSLTARVTVGAGPVQLRVAASKLLEAPHPVSSGFGTLLPSLQTAPLCKGDCRSCDPTQGDADLDSDPACDFEKLKEMSAERNGPTTISAPCAQSVLFRPWALYTLAARELPSTIFRVPPELEPLNDSTWMKVMLEHIEVFRRDRRHVLAFATHKFEALAELNGHVLARYGAWPRNIVPSVAIHSACDVGKIARITDIRPALKAVSFESWSSDPHYMVRILDEVGLANTLHKSGVGWVVLGGSKPQSELSEIEFDDLCYFIRQARAANCLVFVDGIVQSTVDRYNAARPDQAAEHVRMENLQQIPQFAPSRSADLRGFAPSFVPCKVYPLVGLPVSAAR